MSGARALAIAPRPEVIFLDVGDTLLRAHPSWAAVYRSVFPNWGLDVSEDELHVALRAATERGHWDLVGPFEASEEASWARILEFDALVMASLGHRDLPEAFYHDVEGAFAARGSWHVYPDVVPALAALHEAGFRLAIISNWLWSAPDLFHDLEIAAHFETMIISAREGYNKPHPAIFRAALERMGVEAEAALHVGDSYRADVEGARSVGIRAVLIARGGPEDLARVPRGPSGEIDVPVIEDLFGLLELLDVPIPDGAGVS